MPYPLESVIKHLLDIANMSNQVYLYHRCLFYVGYEALQHFPDDVEVLLTTFEEGILALSALQELHKNHDLTTKIYELSRRKIVRDTFYPSDLGSHNPN